MRRLIPLMIVLSCAGCGDSKLEVVPSGDWAQTMPPTDLDLVELQVDTMGAATARFGLDTESSPDQAINYCASATLPRLSLDAEGRFDVSGTLIGRGTGLTEGPPVPAAQFSGTVRGNTMDLTVTTVNGVWGHFMLQLGAPLKGVRLCID